MMAKADLGMARFYRREGNYWAAEPFFKKALTRVERLLSKGPSDDLQSMRLTTQKELAETYEILGHHEDAIGLYNKVAGSKLLSSLDKTTYVRRLANLHTLLDAPDEAQQLYRRELSMLEPIFGTHHPMLVNALMGLADALELRKNYRQAIAELDRALSIEAPIRGPNSLLITPHLITGSRLFEKQGRLLEAEALLRKALAIYQLERLHNNDPLIADALAHLSRVNSKRASSAVASTGSPL